MFVSDIICSKITFCNIFLSANNFNFWVCDDFMKPSIQFIWHLFLGKVRLDDNIRHPRRTRCQTRGAPLPPTRLHLSRWPAPSFRLVPGSPIRQGEVVGCQCRTAAQPFWYAKSCDIQAASRPTLVSHSPDPRVENHGYHERIGMTEEEANERDGERGMARFPEWWPSVSL